MTNELEKIYALHDLIKIHPFRQGNELQYMKDYAEQLCTFFNKVYEYIVNNTAEDSLEYLAVYNALHDWFQATNHLRNQSIRKDPSKKDYINHDIIFLEKVLGEIHFYLDNGYFKTISHYITKGSTLAKHIKPQHLIREYRVTKENRWEYYLPKNELLYYITYFEALVKTEDFYMYLLENYKELYNNFEINWNE